MTFVRNERQWWRPEIPADDMAWMQRANCKGSHSKFFPSRGEPTAEAKALCYACDVRAECLEFALKYEERFGIWGGMSERERRKIRRERKNAKLQGKQ